MNWQSNNNKTIKYLVLKLIVCFVMCDVFVVLRTLINVMMTQLVFWMSRIIPFVYADEVNYRRWSCCVD